MRVRIRAEHPSDDELHLGELLTEHAHERDRATFTETARWLTKRGIGRCIKARLKPWRSWRSIPTRRSVSLVKADQRAVRRLGLKSCDDRCQRDFRVRCRREAERQLQRGEWPPQP